MPNPNNVCTVCARLTFFRISPFCHVNDGCGFCERSAHGPYDTGKNNGNVSGSASSMSWRIRQTWMQSSYH